MIEFNPMGSIVIGDLTNLSSSTMEKNLFGVSETVESLFALYLVCEI